MELFSLIIGFVWGGLACWLWLARRLDVMDGNLVDAETARSIAEHKLQRANNKLAAIRQLLDES